MSLRDETDEIADLFTADEPDPVDPAVRAARRRRRRRGWIVTAVVFALILGAVGGYVGWALHAPLPRPVATVRTVTATAGPAAEIEMPSGGASAVVVTGAKDVIGEKGLRESAGGDKPRPIASISKLVTALVVLDRHPLKDAEDPGPTLRFGSATQMQALYDKYYREGATVARTPPNTTISLRDALAVMLVPSASNYAEFVSTWAYGSQSAFLSATRTWLAEHGLDHTTVVEPTGISARNTSTPGDLLRLGALASADRAVAAIAATASVAIPGRGTAPNTNDLLGRHGVTGLKTGNLGMGSFGLLYTATLHVEPGGALRVIGVRLDGDSRESVSSDVVDTLASIEAGFHEVPVATAGDVVGVYETAWGPSTQLVVARDAEIATWSDTAITVDLETSTPKHFADGEHVGTVTWTAGPETASAPVVLQGTIDPPSDWWRLTHPQILLGAR